MKKRTKQKIARVIPHLYAVLIFLFFYAPVAVMVVFSFNDSRANMVWQGFTTKWYVELFHDAELWGIFGNTLIIAAASTVIALIFGTLGAVGLKDTKFLGKGAIMNSIYFPIVIPEIVLAVATFLIFNMSNIPLGMPTMIVGNATLELPYVYITVKSRLVGMDPSMQEASMDLGAGRVYTFLHITLPAIMPGVLSGAFMAFSLALDELIVTSFLADAKTVTLPMKVYSMIKKGVSPEINAMTTIIFAVCMFVFLIYVIRMFAMGRKLKKKKVRIGSV